VKKKKIEVYSKEYGIRNWKEVHLPPKKGIIKEPIPKEGLRMNGNWERIIMVMGIKGPPIPLPESFFQPWLRF